MNKEPKLPHKKGHPYSADNTVEWLNKIWETANDLSLPEACNHHNNRHLEDEPKAMN